MNLVDIYIYLFIDSILASLVFVPNVEMAYIVMKIFGCYNTLYMTLIAIVGNVIGSCFSYFFGYIIRGIKNHTKNYADSEKLLNLAKVADKYLVYLSIFSFLSIWGVILVCAAGFFRVSFSKFLLCVLLGRIGYYVIPILFSSALYTI
jgi:membrane protein YqaA with SNARE-associated domain